MASTEESAEQRASGSEVPAAMEVSTPSARLSEEEEAEQWLEDEPLASLVGRPSSPSLSLSLTTDFEHEETLGFASLGSQLPGASGSRWINNSGKAWAWAALLGSDSCEAGDEDDDDADMTEKEHMFDKVVTPSDVGKLNRLVIPRQHAEKYFPLDASSANKGLLLSCEDSAGKQWGFRYSYWISSQSYVVTKGWSRFVKEKRLAAGDTVSFSRGAGDAARHRLFIDCKHRMPASRGPRRPSRRRRPAPLYEHHQKDQDLNKDLSDIYVAAAPWPAGRQHPFLGSAGTPMPMNIIPATSSPMLVDDDLGSEESVPLADSPTAAVKRTRLFGISLNSPPWNRDLQQTGGNKEGSDTGSLLAARKDSVQTQNIGGELLMSQYNNTTESSPFRRIGPRKVFKCCLAVVQFVVRIKARARLNQERRKPYVTLESASTEELGVTTDRLLIKRKRRVLAKEAKGKRVVENVRRSKFTEVGKQHFTFHKDVNAWIDIKKQYEGGHTCIQQIVHKLVGRKDIKQMIMKKILLDRNGGSNCTVICIDAGSGHGKTSLLHALYNDQLLTDTFDKSIWIQLSDKFDMVMLFRKIVEVSMNDHCSTANLSCLQEMVKEEIAEKKLLLFLDDADIEDQQFWSTVLEALNAGAKGSAVIMATRSSTVSTFRNLATHSYSLDPLSKENNLMIFQQYSVVGTDILSNPDLLMVAQRFISRFGSNPLNLKAIGGLLCHAESISLEMDDFDESVMPLQLCHDVLPIHLKKCLAFCSLFPEGYIFDKHHMVLRWISHGSVRPAEGCELEDVGVEYFNELLCRCFFQYSPVHSNKDDKFVIPKLMYKVVESVNRDKYFKSEDPTSSIPESILHLSLVSSQFQTVELISKTQGLNDLQTFMVVQPECQPYKISFPTLKLVGLDDLFLKFTSLETLDLSHTDTEELPGSIVVLRNLQYLSVNNTSIRTLPSQLCRLSNLQTLEAKDCRFLTELPGDTKKLLKLHHLDLTKELGYVHLPHGIGQLTELRTLPVFHANGDSSRCSISELGNLHSLRGCLRLSGLESVETGSKALEANLKGKHHLKDLTLQWHDGGVDIDDEDEDAENVAEQVLESLQPHTNLQELAIRGYEGSVFPAWMQDSSSLPNLVSLTLDSCCNCTQFPAIAQLPSLKFLSIRKMYDVQRLTNNIHGATKFPSLELLNLWEMYGLEELFESSDGDCSRLRKVCISRCPSLKRLPCTPSLTELVLHCGQQLPAIPELVSLVSLKIEGFHALRSIKLPAAAALKKLEITSCKELLSVDGLSAMTTVLQRLKVAGCPKLVLPRTDHLTA